MLKGAVNNLLDYDHGGDDGDDDTVVNDDDIGGNGGELLILINGENYHIEKKSYIKGIQTKCSTENIIPLSDSLLL